MNIRARVIAGILAVLGAAALPGSALAAADGPRVMPWFHQQLHDDCEAAALRMVLAARGLEYADRAVLARIGVDLDHAGFGRSGPHSGDPYRAFVGDPDGSERAGTGFGVYAPPIAAAARSFGLTVLIEGHGVAPDLLAALVNAGHPAVVWVDYLWRNRTPSWYRAYDGRLVPYAGPAEHAVTVTTVAPDKVEVYDPARGHYWISTARFTAGYASYGYMAVVVR
ncbi:C39 family peptidase [Streptacidiphilus sp. P02-A3a]|uniref:C39 family peptidase n=1 Tax=Streptacidiphilus sp. P02-A3a TaxID=2704468 RepID=UPI0015F966D2|nr:C39 family peptidase [Streptacidiphilus sp. P02-A3a]QMU69518.1 hypothetical protein GXP74_16015 [Streptacidiphilus sp. P02-A3a]